MCFEVKTFLIFFLRIHRELTKKPLSLKFHGLLTANLFMPEELIMINQGIIYANGQNPAKELLQIFLYPT